MLKNDILRKREDFDSLYKNGKSAGSKYVVLLYRKNGLSTNRFAFVASKKVGKSVQRNRARRLMKEALRLSELELPTGYDMIFIARNTITESKCADVKKSIEAAVKRAGLTA
jgi:ribonuclease P protein component